MELCFSASYAEARQRFIEVVSAVEATLLSYPVNVDGADELFLDVAIVGNPNSPAVMVTSGLHGVEGFFGSAVQLTLLDRIKQDPDYLASCKLILGHALNPYGFANVRRTNEENVDLNRNFLLPGQEYAGAPEGYAEMDSFLNPQSAPRMDFFLLRAIWKILKLGMPKVKATIASGQYEFPNGLFFGGAKPSRSFQAISNNLEKWIGGSSQLFLIDLHTGLGKWGEYQLYTCEGDRSDWYFEHFGDRVEPPDDQPSAYAVRGDFATWIRTTNSSDQIRSVVAEFGTYGILKVLSALRKENRCHYYDNGQGTHSAAKEELAECFCPASEEWRSRAIGNALNVIEKAATAITKK